MSNKGIPTIGVRGIQFRSRIEAQWAYIFEKLEWNWEYEPIDLDGYIPDFIIKFDDEEILIEIKGDTNIWNKEVYKPHADKILQSGWKGQFGILGSVYKITDDFHFIKRINIGKLYQNKWKLYDENHHILENDDIKYDDLIIVLSNKVNKYYIDGLEKKEILECPLYERKDTFNDISEYFQKIWVEAKNKVQWKGIQNKNNFIPNKNTFIKIKENSHKNEKGESYIKYDGTKYEGLSYEESQYFIQKGGISKWIDNTGSLIVDVEFSNLKTIKEILLHPVILDTDKKRIMRCYEKIKMHYELYNELPLWGNIDIFINNKAYIYKVHYDKSLEYLQTNNMNNYKKITLQVPQEPVEMIENDFM
jgi:hypothetical protein